MARLNSFATEGTNKSKEQYKQDLTEYKTFLDAKGRAHLISLNEYNALEAKYRKERGADDEALRQAEETNNLEMIERIANARRQIEDEVSREIYAKQIRQLDRLSNAELSQERTNREEKLKLLQEELDAEIQRRMDAEGKWHNNNAFLEDEANKEYLDQQNAIQEELANLKKAKEIEVAVMSNAERKRYDKEERKRAVEKYVDLTKREKQLQEERRRALKENPDADVSDLDSRISKIQNQKDGLNIGIINEFMSRHEGVFDKISDGLNNVRGVLEAIGSKLDSHFNTYYEHQSAIMTRLEGSSHDYKEMVGLMKSNLAVSPYVTQKKMAESLAKLADEGVAYNIEQRAFLASVSDKIATTFDAFDSNLMRLIRIQQADSTSARMGMEQTLTQFLNAMFEDTSYLSDTFDSVTGALLEASATMTEKQSTEFEYMVQKWLGALGSIGFSSNTLTQIATGIGYLGSGNVNALAGNSGLQSLLAMSSAKAGLDYSQLLVEGLNSSNTNKLLTAMVGYLQEIANNNNVVRAQYSDLYNLSVSDLKAIQTLNAVDINKIANNTLTYERAIKETNIQLATMGKRMNVGEMIRNVADNFFTNVATNISGNTALYTTWLVNDFIEEATGGINVPFISALGNGVDINTNLNAIAKLTMVGASTLGGIGQIISSIGATANIGDLSKWGGTNYNVRGSGLYTSQGISKDTSMSMQIASASSADANASLQSEVDSQVEQSVNKQEKKGLLSKIGGMFTSNSDSSASSSSTKDTTAIYNLLNGKFNSAIPVKITQVDNTVSLNAKVSSIDEAVKNYLKTLVAQKSDNGSTDERLIALSEKILDGTINVNITNDIVEQALSKYMYMGGGQ